MGPLVLIFTLACALTAIANAETKLKWACQRRLAREPPDGNTVTPLVFLHFPKVGGTSVREALETSALKLNLNMCSDLGLPHALFDARTYAPVHTCDILLGHLYHGIIDGYDAAKKPYYSALLRDPLERVVSLYHYVIKYPEHYQVRHTSTILYGSTTSMSRHRLVSWQFPALTRCKSQCAYF
jgi:hypothetical protein